MAGVKRTMKTCIQSKSMQPVWFGSFFILLLICHLIFDATNVKLHFKGGQITFHDENSNAEGNPESEGMRAILSSQVKSGEKPPFVLSEELSSLKISDDSKNNNYWRTQWNTKVNSVSNLYDYKSFVRLPAFTKLSCRKNFLSFIPNVVHFIWFGKLKMNFLQYLSMRSAAAVQKPSLIVLHTDSGEPDGIYWESLKSEIPCLEVRRITKPTKIFGQHDLNDPQQQSHVARLQVLYQEGGIYANLNVIFIRPFDNLMKEPVVLGKEEEQYYSNSVILAARGANFLAMWFTAYNRKLVDWSTYSIYIPWRLVKENPSMPVHVEEYTMMRPNFNEDEWIINKNWVLDNNYCVHLYTNRERIRKITSQSPLQMINMDNTVGQLTRLALFGKAYFENAESHFRQSVHSRVGCWTKSPQENGYIPNILHYVLDDEKFTYMHYLSVRSAVRNLHPSAVYMHMLQIKEPDSFFWIRTAIEIGCITVFAPKRGEKIIPGRYDNDTTRKDMIHRVLQEYGGIYLSFDVIVTAHFTDFLQNHVAMGTNAAYTGNLDVIMSAKKSKFLRQWFSWEKNNLVAVKGKVEKYLDENPEELVQIIQDFPIILKTGGWQELTFDYREVSCFVVSTRGIKINFNEEGSMYNILRSESIIGQVARIAHFGKSEVLDL